MSTPFAKRKRKITPDEREAWIIIEDHMKALSGQGDVSGRDLIGYALIETARKIDPSFLSHRPNTIQMVNHDRTIH